MPLRPSELQLQLVVLHAMRHAHAHLNRSNSSISTFNIPFLLREFLIIKEQIFYSERRTCSVENMIIKKEKISLSKKIKKGIREKKGRKEVKRANGSKTKR